MAWRGDRGAEAGAGLTGRPTHPQSVTWQRPELKDGLAPVPRSGHTFNTCGPKNVLFGGCGRKDGKATTFADVWSLDLSNPDVLKWVELSPEAGAAGAPAPRSRHTATNIGGNRLLVFGGLNHRTRYNDVWIYDAKGKNGAWTKPEIAGDHRPAPRAHHTAVKAGNKVLVFGGYGGHGKVYNDLWVLDLGDEDTPMSWSEPNAKGAAPAPRFDHVASWYPNNMIVFGGRDNSKLYKGMQILNLDTMEWSDNSPPDFASDICNHTGDAIESVPNFKLITFGGKVGMMDYLNSVEVMDCGSLVWTSPTVHGELPVAREDTAWVYDNKSCRLMMFGGWANRWLGDTWALNVSPVIGPPYACMGIEPSVGPVFGDTTLMIKGLGFRDTSKIEVRFGGGKNEVTVPGTFVDEETLSCQTPNYETYGAMEVDVRVSFSGEGWTVNKVKFIFFANTAARNCFNFGPGILAGGVYGVSLPFIIQSKDTCNAKRNSGGDQFIVTCENVEDRSITGAINIIDLNNGLYEVTYSVPKQGTYEVSVGHDDLDEDTAAGNVELIPVRGSPFNVTLTDPFQYPKVIGSPPVFTPGATIASIGTSMALFGANGLTVLSKEGVDWSWAVPETVTGPAPAHRADHMSVSQGQSMYLFGGKDTEGSLLNDLCTLKKSADGSYEWVALTNVEGPTRLAKREAGELVEEESEDEDQPAGEELPAEGEAPAEVEAPAGGEAPAAGGEGDAAEEAVKPADPEPEAEPEPEGEDKPAEGEAAAAPAEGEVLPAEREAAEEKPGTPEKPPVVPVVGYPKPRTNAGMCLVDKKLFVIGGKNKKGNIIKDLALGEIDVSNDTCAWDEQEIANAEELPYRSQPSLVAGANGILMFGGTDHVQEENDEGEVTHVPHVMGDLHMIKWDDPVKKSKGAWTLVKVPEDKILGTKPSPRYGAKFLPYDRRSGSFILLGGYSAAGTALMDAYIVTQPTPDTFRFTIAFQLDDALAPPVGLFCSLYDTEVVAMNSTSSKNGERILDASFSIDPQAMGEKYGFKKCMTKATGDLLDELEVWVGRMEDGLDLAHQAEEISEHFTKLMMVMTSLYEIRTLKDAKDLAIDQMTESLLMLSKQYRVSTSAKEDQLTLIIEMWEKVKAAVPDAKVAVQPVQDVEGERIRGEIREFAAKVDDYRKDFLEKPFFLYATGFKAIYGQLDEVTKSLGELREEAEEHYKLADMFEFAEIMEGTMIALGEVENDMRVIKDVWDVSSLVETQFADWRKTLWNDIDTEMMEDNTKAFVKEVKKLPKQARLYNAFDGLDKVVKNFLVSVPLVADLRSPDMRDRHWKKLMEVTGKTFTINDSFKLDDLLKLELHLFEDDVGEIVDQAQKEAKMEMNLGKLDESWAVVEFLFIPFKDTAVNTVKMAEEAVEALEDNQLLVLGMMGNRYKDTFAERIEGWNKKLMNVADVSQLMSEIQRTWAYLESLFIHSEEVKKELPEAASRFKVIDDEIKKVLKMMGSTKNVVKCCNAEGMMANLEKQQGELEICEKALADYMESKRRIFPRFYFTSTADLLDILSNGNNPGKVQIHMSKCFQAIERLQLDKEDASGPRPKGMAMISCVGTETIEFKTPVSLDGKVEEYMNLTINKMRSELRLLLQDAVASYSGKPRTEWIFDWPSQLILVVNGIMWTTEVEEAFNALPGNRNALQDYVQQQVQQLSDLITVTRTPLEKPKRQKVMNMITIDAHSRDITAQIADKGCDKIDCFEWQSQLRSYWDKEIADCRIKVCDATFPYGYEYLGNGPRLVITPLTDRIYITATQACWLSLGTAPQGPAGTGKTETTKDLSAQLGKSVYVFNCSPEMDYRTMGDIFKGLAASGSWGCFDEFNRLVPAVLSVCSVQYKAVCDAQRVKSNLPGRGLEYIDKEGTKHPAVENYKFTAADGVEMPLEEGCSAFITMNPGYIGRAELPESLKILFRPITVMVPDRQLIMENMLMAEGFTEAKILAKKFASLYYLLEDLLSPQTHYDWGLRAIKSVLVVAGSLLRSREGQAEADVLYRALRDFNVPKILNIDMAVFMGLLRDLFPGTDPERERDMVFEEVIKDTAIEMGLTIDDDFVLRCVQLSELLAIRHCIFLMGPTGVARTECYRTLANALEKGTDAPENNYLQMNNRKKILMKDINPKAISTTELYGYVNMATREWKDGLLSYTMRELANMEDTDPKWILLDGDLDANWIESMNSVMDDNKLLTLPSNERIRLLPHMKLIFEIRDLKFATPATATRAGILYISEAMQWNNMAQSWINRVVPEYMTKAKWKTDGPVEWFQGLFEKYVPPTIFEMKKAYSHITPLGTMNFVTSLVNILEGLLTPKNLNNKAEQSQFETYFVFAVIWAFGSGLAEKDGIDYRKNFDKWFKQSFTTVKLPGKGTVYDFYVNPETGKFVNWGEMVKEVKYEPGMSMTTMFIPTAETASLTFFLDMMVAQGNPLMFVGTSGCGKTQLVQGNLKALDAEEYMFQNFSFNYFTEVAAFQKALEANLEKKAGINYAPPGTKKLIYFVDDLNMPKLDPYETAMPISHIRQHLGWGHWFDRAKLQPKNIGNTQYVAAMNPTAGAFVINPRLQRLFMTLAVQFPGQDSLMQIFGTFLTGHLSTFGEDCQELGNKILQATLAIHAKVSSTFRKTAVNFHYEFTVRHLSNVFQGLLQSTPEIFDDVTKLSTLWLHEAERTYADRLVNANHLATYNKAAEQVAKKFFNLPDIGDYYKAKDAKPLIFCNFARGVGEGIYDSISDWDALSAILVDCLKEYNETNPVMDLVLFEDAMKHVCRISRIISNSSGHALLVGVGGSGKQSLSKLASYICGYTTMGIVISGNYGVNNFKEDLQKMYKKAGVKGEGVTFLFTDAQITKEHFLVFINDLLASGDIPDLFAQEDKDEICNAMRGAVKASGQVDTADNCWAHFIQQVKDNLHMVFTTSPVGDGFRTRSQRFLATVTCTVIDWFQPWPESSLLDVAAKFLGEVELGDEKTRQGIVEFMPFSFGAVNAASEKYLQNEKRYNYTTPKTFLELIKLYISLLKQKREATMSNISRLEEGVTKIEATQEMVEKLVQEANRKAVMVEEKVASSDAFAEKVGIEKEKANEENAAAQIEAEKCGVIATEVAAKQESCQKDLDAAEPLVIAATAALDSLSKKDIQEMKALNKPPAGVDDITAVVIILLNGNPKDKSWKAAKGLMKSPEGFIDDLKGIKTMVDEGQLQKKHVDACRPYIALEHFTPEIIKNKSGAGAGLCDFCINIVKYFDVVSMIEPKRQELREANEKLDSANTRLAEVQEQVRTLNEMVADLERQFNEAIQEKEEAIAESERTQRKLGLANRLVAALSASVDVWKETVVRLNAEYEVLTGDMLLSAAFCSYAGPFTAEYRNSLVGQWAKFLTEKGTPMTAGLTDPVSVLVDSATVAGWTGEGLPSDPTSIQNGTVLSNSERWSLMCDPQLQGVAWIKEKESKNNLHVVRMGASNTVGVIERALEAGDSVLVENMGESIDAVIMPVVTRAFFKKGRSMYVKIGDKEVEYAPGFQLFLHTKLSNPHYPPEIQAETTLINFTVTEKGLEDQLLALVVNKERPELEETKTQLIIQNNEFTIKLKELENKLLQQLAEAQGDITENIELIESLEDSKKMSDEINAKVEEAKETEEKINVSREKYRSVATRGSMLFFLLNNLNKIHAFYQFSLNSFVLVFARGIDNAPGGRKVKKKFSFKAIAKKVMGKFDWNMDLLTSLIPSSKAGAKKKVTAAKTPEPTPEELEKRLGALIDTCTYTVFDYARLGLFDKDKLIVSSMLAMTVLLKDGVVDPDEYMTLCFGAKTPVPPPITDELSLWMTDAQWSALDPVCKLPKFTALAKDMEKNNDSWKEWCAIENCEKRELPGDWAKLSKFQKLLVVRALRPDRITNALSDFVEGTMGDKYTNQPPFDATLVADQSGPSTPIFFILFPGYSPSKEIEEVAGDYGKTLANGKLTIISMGQGQEAPAEETLDRYTKEGGWVFLDNVHLMQEWVKGVLERKLEVAAETGHKDFRCFFSAEPIMTNPMAKIIPESVLQTCIKISNEPPSDMKSNMRRAFAAFSQDAIDRIEEPEKQVAFKSILFGLCFYHSLLLGRKKFGVGIGTGAGSGLGFCRGYSFNMGDLTTCGDVLYNYIQGNDDKTPWEDLRYMFGEVFYGGWITDAMDRRCCITYLDVLVRPELLPDGDNPPTMELAPGFKAPMPADYESMKNYIETAMPAESPVVYGLHPNAELSLLTTEGETLFKTILESTGGGGGGEGGGDADAVVRKGCERFLDSMNTIEGFNMIEIEARVVEKTPYIICALQEAERMNTLLVTMKRSLEELMLGLDGALNMSAKMEALAAGIASNSVPALWMSTMSTRVQEVYSLSAWYADVVKRQEQLKRWTAGQIITPLSVWLPGLFNPKAFVTAVMQTYARANKLPLDVMKFMTEVTTKMDAASISEVPPEGAYVHGFCIEGARWDRQSGCLRDSMPGELHQAMPVTWVRPVTADKYSEKGFYVCPVYMNMQRANVYSAQVSSFTLKTKEPTAKWILASVALLLQDELAA